MKDFVHLYRKIITSWVFQDPRRLQLFIYLLVNADEKGVVEFSLNDYATKVKAPRTSLQKIINEMTAKNILRAIKGQKKGKGGTAIIICKYEAYNSTSFDVRAIIGHKQGNLEESKEENGEKGEKKEQENERESFLPPAPPSYKEKDKEREKRGPREEREEIPTDARAREKTQNSSSEKKQAATSAAPTIDERESDRFITEADAARLDEELDRLKADRYWLEVVAMREHLLLEQVLELMRDFRLECLSQGKTRHENMNDLRAHFSSWIRIQTNKLKRNNGRNGYLDDEDRRNIEQQKRLAGYAEVIAGFRNKGRAGSVQESGTVYDDVPF